MDLRNEKGSITIFVLVALLFITSFLIISYASNVNKSKIVKEQFNIIRGIYSYTNGDEGAYDKAYTDLRKKNKQTLTETVEDSSVLELEKTYEGNLVNYRIYGNGKNLFDINAVTKFYYDDMITEVPSDRESISEGIISNSYGAYGRNIWGNSNITKLESGIYTLSADVINNKTTGYNQVQLGFATKDGKNKLAWINLSSYQIWERVSYTFELTEEKEILAFNIQGSGDTESFKELDFTFKNIQLEKGNTATEYTPYEYGVGDKINLFDINSVTEFFNISGNKVTGSTIEDGIIKNSTGSGNDTILCNSNIKELSAGIYTLSMDVMNNNTSGKNTARVGIYYTDDTYDRAYLYLFSYQTWERKSFIFTVEEDMEVEGFAFQINVTGQDNDMQFKNIQLEKGIGGIEYVPYNKYKISFDVIGSGKNLFDIGTSEDYMGLAKNRTFSVEGNKITGTVQSGAISYFANLRNRYSSGTYSISAIFSSSPRHMIYACDEEGNILTSSDISIDGFIYNSVYNAWYKDSEQVTVTIPNSVDHWYYGSAFIGTADQTETIENIQIEEGATVTTYESSQKDVVSIILDAPLKSEEYIDFKLYRVMRFDGREDNINLSEIKTFEDYTKIKVLTRVKPSKIEAEYIGYTLE